MEESEVIKMAQLKPYLKGLFWSTKDNIYTARLNNVDDTILVHDTNDALTLERMVAQDPTGFKDGQKMIDLFHGFYNNKYIYNNVITEFLGEFYSTTYFKDIKEVLEDLTDSTTAEVVVDDTDEDNVKAVVTLTPEVDTLVKVEFYSDDSDYDITVTLTKTDNSTESFVVSADEDNPFEYFIPKDSYSSVEIVWKYNEIHSNTVTSYVEDTN